MSSLGIATQGLLGGGSGGETIKYKVFADKSIEIEKEKLITIDSNYFLINVEVVEPISQTVKIIEIDVDNTKGMINVD